jgi:outer membrane protein TolC
MTRAASIPARATALLVLAAALGGCASFSADSGFSIAQQAAQQHLGKDLRWARSDADRDAIEQRVSELLARPLDADAAVQIALLNNRGLQAGFFELGIGEAERVMAGRLPNPGFSFGRSSRGDEREIERGLHFNLARLLVMPWATELESRRFDALRQKVALDVLALAAEARKAWVLAVAAEESLRYTRQVMQAAEAGAELARRMEQVGNFSKLQRAREQAFYADAALGVARAERQRMAARERLTRLLGLWGTQTGFTLPERLPGVPKAADELPDIERTALAQRLDVQGAKAAAEQTARNLGLTRATRFVNVLEIGVMHNSSNEAPVQRGWEIGFELPLFDWGDARVRRAEAVYMQAVHRAAETAINARSEVREAYAHYRYAHEIARHQFDEVVPLRQRIADENLLRYNGMLIGVFELLADARAQITSVNGALDALRDFWLARADLEMALIGKPFLSAASASAPSAAAATAGDGDH